MRSVPWSGGTLREVSLWIGATLERQEQGLTRQNAIPRICHPAECNMGGAQAGIKH